MRGLYHSKARRNAGFVMAAVSSFLITACASQRASAPQVAKPHILKKVLAARTLRSKMPALSSVWEGGHCSFKDNLLSYHSYSSGETKTLRLDVDARASSHLICSASYTALLAKGVAYISLGGKDVMGGCDSFGRVGSQATWANSYEVDLPEGFDVGAKSAFGTIVEDKLRLSGGRSSWSIDLSDPFTGWKAYLIR